MSSQRSYTPPWQRIFASANCTSGGVINKSKNVASVSRLSAGIYTVTFTNPAPDTNYSVYICTLLGAAPVMMGTYSSVAAGSFNAILWNMSTFANQDNAFSIIVVTN